jgi:hypothetical protein
VLKVPTVHLNGTSKEALIEQCRIASDAMLAAMRALQDAAPNPRDFYVQEGDAFKTAQSQHAERVKALHAVHQDICAIMGAIENGISGDVPRTRAEAIEIMGWSAVPQHEVPALARQFLDHCKPSAPANLKAACRLIWETS